MDIAVLFRGVILLVVSLCIPLLMYIGFRLFEMGAKGEINISHENDGKKSTISNLSPGAFCFLLSVGLGLYMINSELKVETKSEVIGKAGSTGAAPKKSVSKSTILSFYGGEGQKVSSLVLNEYARAGICLHGLKVTNRLRNKKLNECLANVEKMMKRPISYPYYEDLKKYEKSYEQGDENVLPKIKAWIQDFMNKRTS